MTTKEEEIKKTKDHIRIQQHKENVEAGHVSLGKKMKMSDWHLYHRYDIGGLGQEVGYDSLLPFMDEYELRIYLKYAQIFI